MKRGRARVGLRGAAHTVGAAEGSEIHLICTSLGVVCLCELHLCTSDSGEQGAANGERRRGGVGGDRVTERGTKGGRVARVFFLVGVRVDCRKV